MRAGRTRGTRRGTLGHGSNASSYDYCYLSRNSTPRWARDTSLVRGSLPPPISPAWLMVRGANARLERPRPNWRRVSRQQVRHAVDARHLQRLLDGQGRQRPRQQRLARAGTAAHKCVVPPAGRHLQRTLGHLLRLDLGKVGHRHRRSRARNTRPGVEGCPPWGTRISR